jgi:hypothetical protein
MKLIDSLFTSRRGTSESSHGISTHQLIADEVELSNWIEIADWVSDPIVPFVCTECFQPGCAFHGLAHVIETDDQVVWMKPYGLSSDRYFCEEIDNDQMIRETMIFPRKIWDAVAIDHPELPHFDRIFQVTNIDLYYLWIQNLPSFLQQGFRSWTREGLPTAFARLEENCVAGDPVELDSALKIVREMLLSCPEIPELMRGSLRRMDDLDLPVQTFYFDLEGYPEWKAFVLDENRALILGNEWVLFPGV